MAKTKIQTGQIRIAGLTAAGIYERDIVKLEEGYNQVNGVEVHEINNSGQAYYRLGLKDDSGEIVSLVHVDSFKSSNAVPPNKKAKCIKIRAKNQTIKAVVELPAANGANDLVIDFAIHLEKVENPETC